MKQRNRNIYIIKSIIIAVILTSVSCQTIKHSISPQNFSTFTSSIEIEFTSPENKRQTTNGQIRIIKDSIIQVSMRAPIINTEIIRVNITPYNFTYIDRRNKIFTFEDIENMKILLETEYDFQGLQHTLVTKQTFHAGQNTFLRLSKQKFNRKTEIDMSIPVKYRKVSTEQLIEITNQYNDQ